MKASTLLSTLLPLTSAYSVPKDSSHVTSRIPTARESAILARRILTLTPLGTISTIFPSTSSSHNPKGVEGKPHALMEYISACDPLYPSNPTLLSLNISSTFRNAAGANLTVAVTWTHPPLPPPSRSFFSRLNPFFSDPTPVKAQSYSAAALPRYSLMGYLEPIEGADDPKSDTGQQVQACYTSVHPDAKYWLPGNRIHESHFVRMVVTEIYWVGGFGDRAYIGWIDAKDWESVTKEEIEGVRLPGEKPLDGKDL
ncbi:pyridoxamine 5'-phosphate oxidase-domain-containing protein [Triangularia verruculosa]|uniref:Pyridoxamine 5'-phosphate oxidase-domain-containing protein n=1 Tax=Triangularia verruculosa TaxID=2587418 RepID=A0AAN6X609_9PEZI|nr:pyridoxamine 5'-phosphate oxidase-domain-containing protein [Triangularia verruculosa]